MLPVVQRSDVLLHQPQAMLGGQATLDRRHLRSGKMLTAWVGIFGSFSIYVRLDRRLQDLCSA